MLELRRIHPSAQMRWQGSAKRSMATRAMAVARVDGETTVEGSDKVLDAHIGILAMRLCDRVERETQWSSRATDDKERVAATIGLTMRRHYDGLSGATEETAG